MQTIRRQCPVSELAGRDAFSMVAYNQFSIRLNEPHSGANDSRPYLLYPSQPSNPTLTLTPILICPTFAEHQIHLIIQVHAVVLKSTLLSAKATIKHQLCSTFNLLSKSTRRQRFWTVVLPLKVLVRPGALSPVESNHPPTSMDSCYPVTLQAPFPHNSISTLASHLGVPLVSFRWLGLLCHLCCLSLVFVYK